MCSICGKAIIDRCKDCNKFKVRLSRQLAAIDDVMPSVATDWRALPIEKSQELAKENHELCGRDLALMIHRSTEEIRKSRVVRKLCANGHLKDKVDLEDKYKNKPDQLENIFKNAYSILCPIRQVTLWADPEFSTHIELEESEEFATRLEYKNEEIRKRQKTGPKAKAKAGATQENDGDVEEGNAGGAKMFDFDVGQTEKLTRSQEAIDELQNGTLQKMTDEVKELADYLPNLYVAMARGYIIQCSEESAVVKANIIERKGPSNAKDMLKTLVERKKLINQEIKDMGSRLKVARADKVEATKER